MRLFRPFVLAALTGLLLAGCSKKKSETPPPLLSLNPAETRFFSTSGTYSFEVETNQKSWEVRSDQEWCAVTPDYASGSFSVELSGAPAPAHAAVTVQAGAAAPVTIDFASLQDFDKNSQRSYPPREESYALIVAASSGWENYRHQAGAYLMYQMLKSNGLDDDHILLVSEDDIARHSINPTPGRILPPEGEGNLYENVIVDYKLSEVGLSGLLETLTTGTSFRPGVYDNLFVYWAGRGTPEGPKWLDETLHAFEVADFFKALSARQTFRKLLLVLETDYGGVVGRACEETKIPGMLCFAAADGETSKGGIRTDAGGKIPLSNSFTDTFYELVSSPASISIYELYRDICRTMPYYTNVGVYNANNFGNLYTGAISEFLNP